MNKHLIGLAAALAVGLVGSVAHAAPGQTLALDVTGPDMNPGKVRRCQDVAYRHGFTLSERAPVHVGLMLARNANHLTVTHVNHGPIVDAPRPSWGMDQLCEDAMREAERAYAEAGHRPPPPAQPVYQQPAYAPAPQGGQPTVFLNVVGPASSPDKVSRCMNVAQRRGVLLTNQAPMRVTLELGPGYNRLKIHSARRGEIYNQPKPGWGMDKLCEDAVQQVMMLWDGGGAPVGAAPAYQPPPPPSQPVQPAQPPRQAGYALGPIPPSKELAPPVKALADNAVRSWQAADFDGAQKAFRDAGAQSNDPQFLFDQAVCEQRLTRYGEALQHTQQFLDRAPTSPYRPYAEQLFGELQHAMGND